MSEIETREGVTVERMETVAGAFMTEPGEPFWRIELNGFCADFDYEQAAENFAAQIRALAQTQTFKDGFAAGLEAAAKVAERWAIEGDGPLQVITARRIVVAIRALKDDPS